mmetsp:Transcript_26228/g.65570  ORF Transcript_26228/g.65570 Transcript_26228/m.65570 type:complete len:135 (-) Transcript_26228:1124-1528(-)
MARRPDVRDMRGFLFLLGLTEPNRTAVAVEIESSETAWRAARVISPLRSGRYVPVNFFFFGHATSCALQINWRGRRVACLRSAEEAAGGGDCSALPRGWVQVLWEAALLRLVLVGPRRARRFGFAAVNPQQDVC